MLTGCSFVTLERQIYPICMSVDVSQDGWMVGVQAPRAEAGGNASYEILSAAGDTFDHALRTLSASTPYPLHFGQIRLCLIGYPLAVKTEMRGLLRTLLELPSMRPDCYVSIALGSAMDVMQYQKPDFGMRLSTHLSLLLDRMQKEHLLPDSTLSACVREMSDGRSDMLIGVSALNRRLLPEENKTAPDGGSGGSQTESKPAFALGEPWSDALLPPDIMAGLVPHTSQNPVEYLGAAALSLRRVSGVLTADQVQLTLRLLQEASIRTKREGEALQLQILLPAESELAQNTDAIYGLMETLQALGSDPLLFGCRCSMSFASNAQWEQYDFRRRYPKAEVMVGVTRKRE